MARILRVRTSTSSQSGRAKVLPAAMAQAAWDRVRPGNLKTRVRRLHRTDPANAMTQDALFDQFTNSPNPKHQPTGVIGGGPRPLSTLGPAGAKKVRIPFVKPRPSTAGHDTVVTKPGKVLRDRTRNDRPISGT